MRHSMGRFGAANARRGFTLTEILTVVAIVGLLSAIAVPRFMASMGESQLEADCNRLFADLQWAKTQAPNQSSGMTRSGTRIFVVFDTLHRSWTVYRDNGDSTFNASQETQIKRDSLAGSSRFGFASSFPLPAVAAPLGSGNAPQTGFGASSTVADDCLDGRIFPAPSPQANTWALTGAGDLAGKIVVCGGAVGAMSNGTLYLTSRKSRTKAYAIVFNSKTSGSASYSLRRYFWNGSIWRKL